MKTEQIAAELLEVGQEFKDISNGSKTKGLTYVCVEIDGFTVRAYLTSDREEESPAEFDANELVEVTVK